MTTAPRDDLDLRGSLGSTAVADVLQFLGVGGRTGELHARRSEQDPEGIAWLRDGTVFHAAVGQDQGLPALAEMMSWSEGRFWFTPGAESTDITIEAPLQIVLMEAARLLDERPKGQPSRIDPLVECEHCLAEFVDSTAATLAMVLDAQGSPTVTAGESSAFDVDALAAAFAEIDHGAGFLATVLSSSRQGELIVQFDRFEVMLMTHGSIRLAVVAPESARLGVIRHKTKRLLQAVTELLEDAP